MSPALLLALIPLLWRILFLSPGARLQSAMAAIVWPCWGPCQLLPTLCWLLFCGTISSYGASFHPNYCTSPCTCCWLQECVFSSSQWSRATVSLRETEVVHLRLRDSWKSKGRTQSHVSVWLPERQTLQYAYLLIFSQCVTRGFRKGPSLDYGKIIHWECTKNDFWATFLNISFFPKRKSFRWLQVEQCDKAVWHIFFFFYKCISCLRDRCELIRQQYGVWCFGYIYDWMTLTLHRDSSWI